MAATIDAVAQTTKQGYVYLFERTTGKPLFPIEYREYPPSTVPGEIAPRHSRCRLKPAAYSRQRSTEDMLTNRTPERIRGRSSSFENFVATASFFLSLSVRRRLCFPDSMAAPSGGRIGRRSRNRNLLMSIQTTLHGQEGSPK